MTITTVEIRADFARLSSIDWNDYVELCAREHEEREAEEARRSGDRWDFY
jgi:hypothetical protein